MSRKAYISDHLIYMGDRLQRNYEKLHANGESAGSETTQQLPGSSGAADDGVKKHFLPSLRKKNVPERKNDRERRELEGRVIHDLAKSECELELLQKELNEVQNFYNTLEKTYARLMEIAESSETFDLAPLQAEYFAASGRRQAFAKNQPAMDNIPEIYPRYSNSGNWIVAGAIIVSGIIVSLVLLGIFS